MPKNKLPVKLMLYRRHLIRIAYQKDGLGIKEIADLFTLTRQYIYKIIKSKN